MKLIIALSLLLVSSMAYESYWGKGTDLLDQLQNGESELFVVTFYNPTPVKDDYTRQQENNKVQDELQSVVLNQYDNQPLKIRYGSIDVTDRENEKIIYKAGIKEDYLRNGPVVLVVSKGFGNIVWGPTVIHQVETFVQETQQKASEEAPSGGR